MVVSSAEYFSYTVTVPITLYIESTTPDRALDLFVDAILSPINFNLLKNAKMHLEDAEIIQGHSFD